MGLMAATGASPAVATTSASASASAASTTAPAAAAAAAHCEVWITDDKTTSHQVFYIIYLRAFN